MGHEYKIATVFGGTGFVGTQVVRELAKRGVTVKVATRVPESAYFLRPCGVVGQIVPFFCDYGDAHSMAEAVKNSDYVVNCIGTLRERNFAKAHIDLPAAIAEACTQEDVKRFVHISALGVDQATSQYAQSKLAGEAAVLKGFPQVTILRPSVIFGEDDNFFNMFARLAALFPFLPLVGGGKTKFQPVYVGDVADAVIAALYLPALGKQNPQGKVYELGGPETLDFRQIYETLFSYTENPRMLINLSFRLAKIKAWFMGVLPNPPLTPDQVETLKTDNIVSASGLKLEDLGVKPTAMDIILPTYLLRYRKGGRFGGRDSPERKAA